MPLLCSLRSSFRGAGSRRYRPSSPASMVPRILSFLFLVLSPSASSCDIPPPSSCTLVLVFDFSRSKAQPHHPPVDGRSSTLAAESSLHTGCNEYTPAFDYSVICLRARTESPNMPAFVRFVYSICTWQVKSSGTFVFPWGFFLGLNKAACLYA